ncbi:hypothetical protein [Eikenella longinqua]|nr:hypothetical protein [Eikenella longinqua]
MDKHRGTAGETKGRIIAHLAGGNNEREVKKKRIGLGMGAMVCCFSDSLPAVAKGYLKNFPAIIFSWFEKLLFRLRRLAEFQVASGAAFDAALTRGEDWV